jgi:hypothetical protein
MKTIKSLKDITTLEVGDKVVFGDLEYKVKLKDSGVGYYLYHSVCPNNTIFLDLHLNIESFCNHLGINILNKHHLHNGSFPETKSLESLTAIVTALFKEYDRQNELPKTWEGFCERNPVTPDEYWIETVYSRYCNSSRERKRDINMDKNICVSLQEAKAHTALMQLRQLRKAYVKGWEPDYKQQYYGIIFNANGLDILPYALVHKSMSFPTRELAKQFLTNFKDLLEIAKPLL